MRIGILCFRSYDSYDFKSEEVLKEAIEDLGHEADLVRVYDFRLSPEGELFSGEGKLGHFDGLISRARVIDQVENRLYWLKVLEEKGYKILNNYEALLLSKNKWFSTQRLKALGLPTVPTWIVEDEILALQTAEEIAYPVVLKAPYGTFGLSVEKADGPEELKAKLWKFWRPDFVDPLLLQPFVEEAHGSDLRIFVVNETVVASMKRSAPPGDFRANMELGGTAEPYEPNPEFVNLAVSAVRGLGLDYAGVDIIQTKDGPCILEVNGNPGFLRISETCNLNVAKTIAELAVSRFQKS